MHNTKMLHKLALYFAEHGLPASYFHFKRDGRKPVSDRDTITCIGPWPYVLRMLKEHHRDYWDLAQPTQEFKEEHNKKDPLEALRAGTTEK